MTVSELSAKEYSALFPHRPHLFNSVEFAELNRHKCASVHFLAFSDSKFRGGLIAGERDGALMNPFSAPFGGFDFNREPSAAKMIEIVESLKEWLHGRRCTITLPPAFYAPGSTEKSAYAFQRTHWRQESLINHHLTVVNPAEYTSSLDSKSRNKLKRGLDCCHSFAKLDTRSHADIERAYRIIAVNRARKGYSLRMSLDDVVATAPVVQAEFFILSIDGIDVASAQIYNPAPGIVQVIYWGDTGEASECHPMNLLAYHILKHYSGTGIKVIDVGPSGDFDTLNPGLADFKESIGCTPTLKFRYTIN